MTQYGQKHGLDIESARETLEGFKVVVTIDPTNGRVRYMPFLAYEKSLIMKTSLDDQWRELFAGTSTLIGRYHYQADWTVPEHVEEGSFEIRKPTDLTFRNHAKPNDR